MTSLSFFEKYIFLEETSSTNDVCKSLAETENLNSAIVVTNYQSAGRGTSGRSWEMAKSENLMFSIMLRPNIDLQRASGLTMVMALAVVNSLKKYTNDFKIKWPNDIIYNGKKVCGILTETNFKNEKIDYVVIGAGINCNQMNFSSELENKAISLKKIVESNINKEELLLNIIEEFNYLYSEFLQYGIKSIINDIRECSAVIGKNACIILDNVVRKCRIIDISLEGELLVEYENGSKDRLVSAQIFVDGIYNYVFK